MTEEAEIGTTEPVAGNDYEGCGLAGYIKQSWTRYVTNNRRIKSEDRGLRS